MIGIYIYIYSVCVCVCVCVIVFPILQFGNKLPKSLMGVLIRSAYRATLRQYKVHNSTKFFPLHQQRF
jgi:hypothetical protein